MINDLWLYKGTMSKKNILYVAWGLFCSVCVWSDRIVMVNGDTLSGVITQTDENEVVLDTKMLGEVNIPLRNIETMSDSDSVGSHEDEKPSVDGRLDPDADKPDKTDKQPNRLADADADKKTLEKPSWEGDISIGTTYATGNSSYESYSYSTKLSKETEQDRKTYTVSAARREEKKSSGSNEVTENWWRVGGKHDYFLNKKFYVYGQGRYETDTVADLDRRIIAGGGSGYQWLDSKITSFSTEAGASWIGEEYGDDTTSNKVSAQAGCELKHAFNDVFSLTHSFDYFPNTEDITDYYLTATGELRAKINSHLFTSFKLLFDYDATPSEGTGNSDTKYTFGFGVKF